MVHKYGSMHVNVVLTLNIQLMENNRKFTTKPAIHTLFTVNLREKDQMTCRVLAMGLALLPVASAGT